VKIIELVTNNPLLLIPISFAIVLIIQLFYYLFFYSRILFIKNIHHVTGINNPVSVIICARNEADNLTKNLPLILNQQYSDFEVIVVNDCSEDETEFVLERFQKQYKHLKVTTIKQDAKFRHSKKLALTIGIKAAQNEWILLTDADCCPESPKWIERMQGNFLNDTDIVIGYGGFYKKKSFLNNLIRFDSLFIALQYFTFAIAGKPYMGVGRNLAYRKSLFFTNKGFANHRHLDSGDDDLFVNEVATGKNTRIELTPESITRTESKPTFRDWYYQKKRHITTGHLYKASTKFRLAFEVFSRVFFYPLFILCLIFFTEYYIYILGAFTLRMILQLIIIKVTMNRLKEKFLLLPSLLYDIIVPYLNFMFLISNIFTSKQLKWK